MPQHGQRRHGIGRGDDGTERDTGRERHIRHHDLRDHRHGEARHHHRADREPEHRLPARAQIAQRRTEARIEQNRREEQGEGEFRIQLQVRHAGTKARQMPPMARKAG